MISFQAISLMLLIGPTLSFSAPFCTIQCKGGLVTSSIDTCKRPVFLSQEMCIPYFDITKEFKKDLVNHHNVYRSYVAQGFMNILPPASNMKVLEWDENLEKIVQDWSFQCQSRARQTCNSTFNETNLGMSMGIYENNRNIVSTDRENPNLSHPIHHLQYWFDEVADFKPDYLNTYHYDKKTARISQMIWAETEAIGCTRVVYTKADDETTRNVLVCAYAPGGNQEGRAVYKQGDPGSKCPKGFSLRTVSKYRGLCQRKSSSNLAIRLTLHAAASWTLLVHFICMCNLI